MYAIYIPGKHPCGPKEQVMFKCPWELTWDTMAIRIRESVMDYWN